MRPWWNVALVATQNNLSAAEAARVAECPVGLASPTAWMSSAAGAIGNRTSIELDYDVIVANNGYEFSKVGRPSPDASVRARVLEPQDVDDCRKIAEDLIPAHRAEGREEFIEGMLEDLADPARAVVVTQDPVDGQTKGYLVYDRHMEIGDQSTHLSTTVNAASAWDTIAHLPALLAAFYAQRVVDFETAIVSSLNAGRPLVFMRETFVDEDILIDPEVFAELDDLAWKACFDPQLGVVPNDYQHVLDEAPGLPVMLSDYRTR